jgi:hypothetical protein
MVEVVEKERLDPSPSAAAEGDDGRAGKAGTGSAQRPATWTGPPAVLTPETFRTVGSTLNGKHWQADIGQLIGISRSQVTRYLKREREMNALVPKHLQYVVVERINQLIEVMALPGMPYANDPALKEVMDEIRAAIARVPGQEPPRNH